LLFLLASVPPPAIADDVMLGRKGGTPLSWNPVTGYPLSDHVHFRVNVPQNATSGEFTVYWPNGFVEHPSGTFCMFGAQRAFTTGLEFTGFCLDDEWSVSCVVHRGQGGDLTFGPTSFDVKNLSVGAMYVGDGGLNVDQDAVFASVSAVASGTDFTVLMHDGIEVLPPGAGPQQWVVDAALCLVPLAGGTQVSATGSGDVGESTVLMGALDDIQPGLYYKNVTAHERMLSAPSGGPDTAQAYSAMLTIDSAAREGFEFGGEREGSLLVHLHTSPAPLQPSSSLAMLRLPDGSTEGVLLDLPASADGTVATSAVPFALAGTYHMGLTLMDTGGNMHDGETKWAVPKAVSMDIPAAAHFAGAHYKGSKSAPQPGVWRETVDEAYNQLAWVKGTQYDSFYSGRPQVGVRGGPVYATTLENLQHAFDEDKIVHWVGHGAAAKLWLSWTESYTIGMVHEYAGKPKLIFLDSCNGLQGGANSIGSKMNSVGKAEVVIGYTGYSYGGAGDEVDQSIWYYLAKECCSVKDALKYAKRDYIDRWGTENAVSNNIHKLTYVGNGGTRIVHAFS